MHYALWDGVIPCHMVMPAGKVILQYQSHLLHYSTLLQTFKLHEASGNGAISISCI